jgi:hypothetical protein
MWAVRYPPEYREDLGWPRRGFRSVRHSSGRRSGTGSPQAALRPLRHVRSGLGGAERFASDAKLARAAGIAPNPRQLRQDQPAPARSRRQPPDQRRDSPDRDHPRALPPRDPRLHRPKAGRRQDEPRCHPLPQTTPHPPHLAAPPAAHPDPSPDTHKVDVFDIGAARAAVAPTRGCAVRAGLLLPGASSSEWSVTARPCIAPHDMRGSVRP